MIIMKLIVYYTCAFPCGHSLKNRQKVHTPTFDIKIDRYLCIVCLFSMELEMEFLVAKLVLQISSAMRKVR